MNLKNGIFHTTVLRRCFFCGSVLLAMVHVCLYYAILSVPCSLVVTVGKGLALALLCVLFSCVLSLSSVSPMARLVPINMF